jgi:hypothetical protein
LQDLSFKALERALQALALMKLNFSQRNSPRYLQFVRLFRVAVFSLQAFPGYGQRRGSSDICRFQRTWCTVRRCWFPCRPGNRQYPRKQSTCVFRAPSDF